MTLKTLISGDATHPGIIKFINDFVITLIVAFAIFFFLWNAFQLVMQANQPDEVAKFKSRIIWSLVAIAAMLSVWGLVALVFNSTGLDTASTLQINTGP